MNSEHITSRKNPVVLHMKKLAASQSYRSECEECLCQGKTLYREVLKSDMPLGTVMYCGEAPEFVPGVRYIEVNSSVIEAVSSMKSVPDLIFTCKIPDLCLKLRSGYHIILENMQDPGNVGTIIRTALAFNVTSVILVGSCADPFSPKTIRASMGAVFFQALAKATIEALNTELEAANIALYAASLSPNARNVQEIGDCGSVAVAIGNEGQGLSEKMLDICSEKIKIPMQPDVQSLNAANAAAVIMWELYKNGDFSR